MANIFRAKSLISRTGVFSNEVVSPNLIYNTGDQTIYGVKDFDSLPTVNGSGLAFQNAGILTKGTFESFEVDGNYGDGNLHGFFVAKTTNRSDPSIGLYTYQDDQTTLHGSALIGIRNGDAFLQSKSNNVRVETIGGNLAILNASGASFDSRPIVNGTGVLLSGEVANLPDTIVYTTGNQTISGIKTFDIAPVVSGNSLITGNLSLYATTVNLESTGSTLNNNIQSLSGTLTSTYATISNLASTGSTLISSINSLNDSFTGFTGNLDATYATDTQLFNTGSALDIKINSLSGSLNSSGINLTNTINSLSGSLNSSGLNLNNRINLLSGVSVLTYGNQNITGNKTFINNIEVQGTGIFNALDLSNISDFSFSGVAINLIDSTVQSSGQIYISGNPVLTGVDLSSYATNYTLNSSIDSLSGSLNSSGIILTNSINSLSGSLNTSGLNLINSIDSLSGSLNSSGINLTNSINSLSGLFTGYTGNLDATFATDAQLLNTGSTLDNKINSLSGVTVLTYSDQTISGLKDFTTRPTVNTTPVLLSGEYAAGLNLLVKNNESFTLYKGQPVYINSAAGNNLLIKIAANTGEYTSSKTLGILYQDLAPNDQGYVITEGQLEGINTDAGNAGDPIWLGATGDLIFGTANKPYGANHLVYLGVVERKQANNGKIYVKVQNGFELEELHNVDINHRYALSNDDILRYDSTSGIWYNRPINTGIFQTQISSLSGTLTSDYATIINLALTGNTLTTNLGNTGLNLNNSIISLSGLFTGFTGNLDATYATDIQLLNTGITLNNSINSLSGASVLTYGNQNINGNKTFLNNVTVSGTGTFNAIDLDNIDNLSLSGVDVTLTNSNVNVAGNIFISGNPVLTGVNLTPYATTVNLALTGLNLSNNINSLSGLFTGYTGNLDSTFASDTQLTNTGVTLVNSISSLSGTLTSDYVTKNNGIFTNTPTVNGTNILLSGEPITSGDLTGYLPYPTVNKLQGYKVDLSATPAPGQVLEWNGTSWAAGTIPLGGGGGGGRFYYFNFLNTTGIAPSGGLPTTGDFPLSLLGRSYDIGSGLALSADLDPEGTEHLICGFVSASGDPGVTNIPAGLWDFNIWAKVNSANATQSSMLAKVHIYNPNDSTYRLLGTSDNVYLYDTETISQYILNVTVPQTGILSTERIYIEIYGKKYTSSSRKITMYFDSYRPSHVHTTIPSVAGNGVVKVIDGVFQTPATGIFDNDVDNNANIAQSKIANLSSDLTTIRNTGTALDNKINSLSGTLTNDYLTTSSASSTYATITNLALTGSTLQTNINNLSNTYATITNVGLTGATLNSSINSLSGLFTGYTGTLDATYATDLQLLNTGTTLNDNITSLSGLFTGFTGNLDATYATDVQLANTGTTLNTRINNLSGYINSTSSNIVFTTGNQIISGVKTFAQDATFGDTGQGDFLVISGNNFTVYGSGNFTSGLFVNGNPVLTGVDLTPYATTSNLALTGSTLDAKINSLSGTLTGDYLTTSSASNTYATISNLASTGSTLVTNLASTGSTLDIKINNLSGYINSTGSNILFTTGNQTINGNKSFTSSSVLTVKTISGFQGSSPDSLNLIATNDNQVVSNVNLPGNINLTAGTGSTFGTSTYGNINLNAGGPKYNGNINLKGNIDINTATFGDPTLASRTINIYRTGNLFGAPAGITALTIDNDNISLNDPGGAQGFGLLISGVLVTPALYATSTNLASTGSILNSNITSLSGLFTGYTGTLDATYATDLQLLNTGITLNTRINNLSGYVNSTSSNIVFTTGNQNIGGNKTFTGVTTFSGQEVNLVDTALNLSGLGDMTFSGTNINFINSPVFISGTNLRVAGDVLGNNLVYNTGSQIISGVKTFIGNTNISGNLNVTGNSNIRGSLDVTGLVVSGLGTPFILKSASNGNSVYFDPTLNGNAGILFANYFAAIGLQGVGDQNLSIGYGGGGTRDLLFTKSSINRAILDSNGNFGIGSGISSVPSRFYVSGNSILQGDLTISGNTTITGHLSAASKSFLIDHPTQVGKKLQYGSLESPYHGIRLTDKNKISADIVKVYLPEYISSLVNDEKINIQLTNINHDKILFIKEVNINENNFIVGMNRGWFDKNEYEFYWSFTAERKDIPKLTVEF